jgi:hypothetical protein
MLSNDLRKVGTSINVHLCQKVPFVLACLQTSAAPRPENTDSDEKDAFFSLDTQITLLGLHLSQTKQIYHTYLLRIYIPVSYIFFPLYLFLTLDIFPQLTQHDKLDSCQSLCKSPTLKVLFHFPKSTPKYFSGKTWHVNFSIPSSPIHTPPPFSYGVPPGQCNLMNLLRFKACSGQFCPLYKAP